MAPRQLACPQRPTAPIHSEGNGYFAAVVGSSRLCCPGGKALKSPARTQDGFGYGCSSIYHFAEQVNAHSNLSFERSVALGERGEVRVEQLDCAS